MPVGTPLYAPETGLIRARMAGTGGGTLTLRGGDGNEYEVMHLSGLAYGLVMSGAEKWVSTGTLVGYSGGAVGHPWSGSSDGPHAHEHYYNQAGQRRPMSEIVTGPAGGGTTPFPQDQGEDDMRVYEDAGPTLQNVGQGTLYVGAPGVFVQWPAAKFKNDRAILAQSFGPIVSQSTADIAATRHAYQIAAPPVDKTAVSKVITDAINAALADVQVEVDPATIKAVVDSSFDEHLDEIADVVVDEEAERLKE